MSATAATVFDGFSSQASSDEADYVDKHRRNLRWHASHALWGRLDDVLVELDELYLQCRDHSWDGYEAEPVLPITLLYAREFLRVLPGDLVLPSVGVEPDGQITLEWYQSPRRVLSISVTPDAELHYAALLGASKHYGSTSFTGAIPDPVLGLVKQLNMNG